MKKKKQFSFSEADIIKWMKEDFRNRMFDLDEEAYLERLKEKGASDEAKH